MPRRTHSDSFTFIELFIALSLTIFIAFAVLFAINPEQKLASDRNGKRILDVQIIRDTLRECRKKNECRFSQPIANTPIALCTTDARSCTNGVQAITTGTGAVMPSFPSDPLAQSGTGTLYTLKKDENGLLIVAAPLAENGIVIEMKE